MINKYRKELDGLRAFAVIPVIINHFDKNILPSGYLGVDIFFVISGYVITSSLSKRSHEKFKDFILGFYERRIRRIIPSLIFFVLITSFLLTLFNNTALVSLRTGISSLFGLSNLYLLRRAFDYFSQLTELNPFAQTWSLGVEEQFYFVFPFLFWILNRISNSSSSKNNLLVTNIFLSIISLIFFIKIYPINQEQAYYLMPTRFWEISAGCILYLAVDEKKLFSKLIKNISPDLICLAIVCVFCMPQSIGLGSTITIVFLSFILIATLRKDSYIKKFFCFKKVNYIGKISYSLYLWHWGILCLSRWTIGIYWWTIPFQILSILLISDFSYKYIEEPFRKNQYSISRNLFFAVNLLLLVITSIVLYLFSLNNNFLFTGTNGEFNIGEEWRWNIKSVSEKITGRKCNGDDNYSKKDLINIFKYCIITNKKSSLNKTIAFAGDSHVLPLMSAQNLIFNSGYNLIHHSYNGCLFPLPKYGVSKLKCAEFARESSITLLNKLQEGDYLIIFNYHLSHLGDSESQTDTRNNIYDENGSLPSLGLIKRNIYLDSLNQYIEKLNRKKINVLFIGSGMRNIQSAYFLKEWFRPYPKPSNYEIEKANAIELNNYFKKYLIKKKNLIFLDPITELIECCSNDTDFLKYYRDGDHLSDFGAKKLTKIILQKISKHEYSLKQ